MKIQQIPAILLVTISLFLLLRFPVFANDEDPCRDQGITVKNLTFKELWFKRKDGECTLLNRNHSFTVKPGEEIGLFSDMVCQTLYCAACNYANFKAYDTNNDCRMKMLPENAFSDM